MLYFWWNVFFFVFLLLNCYFVIIFFFLKKMILVWILCDIGDDKVNLWSSINIEKIFFFKINDVKIFYEFMYIFYIKFLLDFFILYFLKINGCWLLFFEIIKERYWFFLYGCYVNGFVVYGLVFLNI